MHPPYFDDDYPYDYDEFPVPKRRANCQVNKLMQIDENDFRMPVGRGWKRTPLDEPIIFEMSGGVFEIVDLPPVKGTTPKSNIPPMTDSASVENKDDAVQSAFLLHDSAVASETCIH